MFWGSELYFWLNGERDKQTDNLNAQDWASPESDSPHQISKCITALMNTFFLFPDFFSEKIQQPFGHQCNKNNC